MFKTPFCVLYLALVLPSFLAEEPTNPDLNLTQPTWPPFLKPTGLFKFVQSCEQFCDEQFPPQAPEAGVAFRSVLGCHKGCYSFELFKVMSKQSINFSILEEICSANCKKDFTDASEDNFTQKFCSLGCSRMHQLYRDRIRELRLDFVEKLRKQAKDKDIDTAKVTVFEQEAEKKIREQQDSAADEVAVAAVREYEKEHEVRILNRPIHRHGSKPRIIQVERFVEHRRRLPYGYVEIQRIDTEMLPPPGEDRPNEKPEEVNTINAAEVMEEEKLQRKKQEENKRRKLYRIEKQEDCFKDVPIVFLVLLIISVILITISCFFRDPDDWKLCWGRKFLEKVENAMYEEELIDNLSATVMDGEVDVWIEHLREKQGKLDKKIDYASQPPPEKGAPPPYREVTAEYEEDEEEEYEVPARKMRRSSLG